MNTSISFSKMEDKFKDQAGCIQDLLPEQISDDIFQCGKRDACKEGGKWPV
jgi:hypothetical protein